MPQYYELLIIYDLLLVQIRISRKYQLHREDNPYQPHPELRYSTNRC